VWGRGSRGGSGDGGVRVWKRGRRKEKRGKGGMEKMEAGRQERRREGEIRGRKRNE